MRLKIDLHVHSYYSTDSLIRAEDILFHAKKRGLDGVAITDHDRLDGALKIMRETDFLVIPGIEVTTLNGHVAGLNVQQEIPKGLTVDETVDKIHRAGGIAVACHPTAFLKMSVGKHTNSGFDAIEVLNASAIPFGRVSRNSEKIAARLGIPRVAGSDAHYGPEIGLAYTVVESEPQPEAIAQAIYRGSCEPFGTPIPFATRLRREILVLGKRL